jgi:O-acetyl-ADP-ribose deacetylase (regulator of RNase III)
MTMVYFKHGNILNAEELIICQQVNCLGVMGAGLAKQLRDRYPRMYQRYAQLCENHGNQPDFLLGLVQYTREEDHVIANLFAQLNYGRSKQQTNYDALRKALYSVSCCEQSIAIPYCIGCGLAGGDWDIVLQMIKEIFNDHVSRVVIYKLDPLTEEEKMYEEV